MLEKEVNKEKNKLPKGVINEEAYRELIKREQELRDSPDRFYHAITADVTFDLFTAYYRLLQKVEASNIADYEVELIKDKAKKLIGERGKLQKYRYAAFKGGGEKFESSRSILDQYKTELLGLFGRFYTVSEVHKVVTIQWGIEISYLAVENFRKKHLDLIQVEQDKYVKDWSGLKLVYKKSRLNEYSELYEDRKIKYEETKHREDYRLLLQTLEAIRKEIEGDRLTVDGGLEINIQQTIDLHIQQDLLRSLNILQFIIVRVAVRMGINQSFLMERLEKSYYAKFTGIKTPDNNRNIDEIYYPSRELYDFNKIKILTQDAQIIEEEKKDKLPELKEESKNVRNALLEALLKRKKVIIENEKKIENSGFGDKKNAVSIKHRRNSLAKNGLQTSNIKEKPPKKKSKKKYGSKKQK